MSTVRGVHRDSDRVCKVKRNFLVSALFRLVVHQCDWSELWKRMPLIRLYFEGWAGQRRSLSDLEGLTAYGLASEAEPIPCEKSARYLPQNYAPHRWGRRVTIPVPLAGQAIRPTIHTYTLLEPGMLYSWVVSVFLQNRDIKTRASSHCAPISYALGAVRPRRRRGREAAPVREVARSIFSGVDLTRSNSKAIQAAFHLLDRVPVGFSTRYRGSDAASAGGRAKELLRRDSPVKVAAFFAPLVYSTFN
ncbi:hypothetical protein EVAR_21172_1 [Eumeta japonica]|uniref:Uncharacterized protein n=1 Tax=Eumeta variegata TaxID=151549 RepID=A0A4C1UPZ6_EUMVA|nr:hypothetical protein EVAR_21172_1 [Eumeta japonica]